MPRYKQNPIAESYLYAVKMLVPFTGTEHQPIKIGLTTNPEGRRGGYGSGPYPCLWIGVWPGDRDDERDIHSQFYYLRQKGEWFEPDAAFRELIAGRLAAYWELLESRAKVEADPEYGRAQFQLAGEVLVRAACL